MNKQLKGLKLVTFDIETMANLVWSWDKWSKGGWRAIDTELEWFPISFGAKWYGEKTRYYSITDYKGFKPVRTVNKDGSVTFRQPDIRPLMQDAWNIMDVADYAVGWNSISFDIKKLNDCFLALGFPPYSPVKHIDLMREKRRIANSSTYSLDGSSEQWGTGRKVTHEGFPLWKGVIEGDKKADKLMKKYCIRDVELTERNLDFMGGWISQKFHAGVHLDMPDACWRCGTEDKWQSRGLTQPTRTGIRYRRFQCQFVVGKHFNGEPKICGAWSRGNKPEKTERPTHV